MRKATCENCRKTDVWVNIATWKKSDPMELCADCFEVILHDEPQRNRTVKTSGLDHNNPCLDNAIRALEDTLEATS